jgi:hypothetical protein
MHVADREVRAIPIEHQPIHWKDRIMRRGDLHRRRIEHESGSFMRRREGDRDARSERLAHQNDTVAVISARTRFQKGGFAILHQALLCRRASRAAIAAIGYSKKPVPARRKRAKTRNAIDQSAAIAVKIQDQRMPVLCRNISSDQRLSVNSRKTQVFDAAHAASRGIDQATIWKILEAAPKDRQADNRQIVNSDKQATISTRS